jgi:hypothetical protein
MNNINLSSLSISNNNYEDNTQKITKKEKVDTPTTKSTTILDGLKLEIKNADKPKLNSYSFLSESKSNINIPKSYTLKNKSELKDGIDFFELNNGNDKKTIRAVEINPSNLKNLNVLFSRDSSLNIEKVHKDPKNLVVMNGTFFTGTGVDGRAAGDLKGIEKSVSLKANEKKGLVTNAETSVRKEIEQRFSFAVDNSGKASIFKGGLDDKKQSDFKTSIGGGVLLFDSKDSSLYKNLNNESSYESDYLAKNDKRITSSGQGGDPNRATPRSAIGIMSNGSTVLVNIGEGIYRRAGGMTPYQVAKTLKEMGCVSAIMFDGGGAPVLKAKDENGKEVTNSSPDIKGGYSNNKSLIVISK